MTDWLTSNLALRACRDAMDAHKKREQQAEAQRQLRAERQQAVDGLAALIADTASAKGAVPVL